MDNIHPSLSMKVKCRTNNPPSIMQGNQVHVPPSAHQPPPHQLPLVSPPSLEDLWHFPGRLRINPSLWNKDDVTHWLRWAQKEYSLRCPGKRGFEMNGRALCLLTKDDFRHRCPSSGDVLYELLQYVKQQRRSFVCPPPNASHILLGGNTQRPPHSVQEPQLPPGNDDKANLFHSFPHFFPLFPRTVATAVPAVVETSLMSQPVPSAPLGNCPPTSSTNFVPPSHSTAFTAEPHKLCPPQTQSITQEQLNLSSREKPCSPLCKANGRIPECRLLWDYVYQLLCDDRYQEYIRWEDQDSLVFKVVDPNGLARLWGNHKNRRNMTYEKMSRALRHYYKLNIIKKERGQKLLFRFLKLPQAVRKQVADPAESPEHSPCYKDSPDIIPSHEFVGVQFEISPDHSSPEAPP
ncbi:transcription factor ETV7 [Brachionichthys hirsutus]|uniref:transcription factor ETV7 n=1 Tax=Brachionichthys hirsutus TaxID=412623 RepID=UPI0036050A11